MRNRPIFSTFHYFINLLVYPVIDCGTRSRSQSDTSDCGEPILTKKEPCDYVPFVPVEEPGLDLGMVATVLVILVLGAGVVYAVLNRQKLLKRIKG